MVEERVLELPHASDTIFGLRAVALGGVKRRSRVPARCSIKCQDVDWWFLGGAGVITRER